MTSTQIPVLSKCQPCGAEAIWGCLAEIEDVLEFEGRHVDCKPFEAHVRLRDGVVVSEVSGKPILEHLDRLVISPKRPVRLLVFGTVPTDDEGLEPLRFLDALLARRRGGGVTLPAPSWGAVISAPPRPPVRLRVPDLFWLAARAGVRVYPWPGATARWACGDLSRGAPAPDGSPWACVAETPEDAERARQAAEAMGWRAERYDRLVSVWPQSTSTGT